MNEDTMTSDEVFEAISHPMRIKLLKILAKKPCGFADLKRQLKIKSSGQLDFHLKKMDDILTSNKIGQYTLNARGYSALQAVDVVSNYGWQRRAYFINLFVVISMNAYFLILLGIDWFPLGFIVFLVTLGWIIFYSYWTFVKRKVHLRSSAEENGDN